MRRNCYLMSFEKLQIYLVIFNYILFLVSCEQKSNYKQIVERELVKGVQNNELFLGYYFGMTEEDFFNHSWEMNKKGILTGDTYIRYNLDLFDKNARMRFYPEFKNGKIFKMPVEISYDGWAPWNVELSSDSLIVDLMDLYQKKYNADFKRMYYPKLDKKVWIDVNGNRRIILRKQDERTVQVEFFDLLSADDSGK